MDGAPLKILRRSMSPQGRRSDVSSRAREDDDDDVELDEDELEDFLNGAWDSRADAWQSPVCVCAEPSSR